MICAVCQKEIEGQPVGFYRKGDTSEPSCIGCYLDAGGTLYTIPKASHCCKCGSAEDVVYYADVARYICLGCIKAAQGKENGSIENISS